LVHTSARVNRTGGGKLAGGDPVRCNGRVPALDPLVLSIGFALGAVVAGALVWAGLSARMWLAARAARKDGVRQARSVLKGQISEQLAPLLPGFDYEAKDARFLGAPIDYIVFDGYSDDDDDDVDVVFVEVKTGAARLSQGEKRIRRAIEEGRVFFETVRLD
jgi:hypothetical protein